MITLHKMVMVIRSKSEVLPTLKGRSVCEGMKSQRARSYAGTSVSVCCTIFTATCDVGTLPPLYRKGNIAQGHPSRN